MSIIPSPGPRPTTTTVSATITSGPNSESPYAYTVASGTTLYAANLETLFGVTQGPWDITNNGIMWSANFSGANQYGTKLVSVNTKSFSNSGLFVFEIVEDIEYGAQLNAFGNNNSKMGHFSNTGSIYIINNTHLITATAEIFDSYNPQIDIFNSGLIAVKAVSAVAQGFDLHHGGHLLNTATGSIIVEGNSATAIYVSSSSGGGIENYGLIEAASVGTNPAIGIWTEASRLFNYAGGTIRSDIAVYGSGWLSNGGLIQGVILGAESDLLEVTNLSGGRIEGDIVLGNREDKVINTGTIVGDLSLRAGVDLVDNRGGGIIAGVTDLGQGNDTYHGSIGTDVITGDAGSDILFGYAGNDLLAGSFGDDFIDGGAGADGLYGENGNDIIITSGADVAIGGAQDDEFRLGDFAFALIDGECGFDTLVLPAGGRILDLSSVVASGRVVGIEAIKLTDGQELVVRQSDVGGISGGRSQLFLTLTTSDKLHLVGDWQSGGTVLVNGNSYKSYTLNGAEVLATGPGTIAAVASAPGGAVGLDAVAPGGPAPEPGPAIGLILTPPYLKVDHLRIVESTSIDLGDNWYGEGTASAVWSDVTDNPNLTFVVDGSLAAFNDVSSSATAIDFRWTKVVNNGVVGAYSSGPMRESPDRDPSVTEGATAIFNARSVLNNGSVIATAEFGAAAGLGNASYTLPVEAEGNPGKIVPTALFTTIDNHGRIAVQSISGHAWGVAAAIDFTNASTGTIIVEGWRLAVGAISNASAINHGTIVSRIADGGPGRAYGIIFLDSFETNQHLVVNTGKIEATNAIAFFSTQDVWTPAPAPVRLNLDNSGEIIGNITATKVHDQILNSGTIIGLVDLGEGNDSYDGRSGHQTGGISGGGGHDTMLGGEDSENFTGGNGNDTINGGGGVDTAIVAGLRSAYAVTQTSPGVFTVVDPDGTDTLTNVEYLQFNDQTLRLRPGTGTNVNFNADPATYMGAIRDFSGNDLGGANGWKKIGAVDVNGDGDIDQILVNKTIGRFAEIGTAPDGQVYFGDHGWAGETRVVGIYIDPLVQSGQVQPGSDHDSQRRFQNDLQIENINKVLGAGDYDHDGLQEVYFALTDETAYLHAYMHADGNIRYANYQNQQQAIDFLSSNGWAASTYDGWFA